VAVALLPVALTVLLVRVLLGASLFDTTPIINDEVCYWVEIDTFRAAGFNGGYHSTNEQAAPATFCHFDPKGPGYAILHGLAARVVGWEPWSGPVFNLTWLTVGVGIWLWAVRPTGWRLAAVAFLIATYWPCLLWTPSTMQEPLHCAFAFLLAAAVQRAFVEAPGPGRFAAVVLMIAAFAQVRLAWAFVLIPWAWLGSRGFRLPGRVVIALLSGVLLVALGLFAGWLNAPHTLPDGAGLIWLLLRKMQTSQREAQEAIHFFVEHAKWNFFNLVRPDGGHPLEVLFRYELLGLLAVAAVMTGVRRDPDGRRPWVFTLLNLGPLLVASVLIYDVAEWRDYRVLSAFVLLSLLVLAASPEWRWSLAPAAANLLWVMTFAARFEAQHLDRVRWDRDRAAAFRAEVRDAVRYDPSRPAWDNTLLIPVQAMTYPMIGVPAGIGVNCVLDWRDIPLPAKSRYLLVPPEFLPPLREYGRLEVLKKTPMGVLCLNVDAGRAPTSRRPVR
jgi:hypothetical protein